jgi:hypothetical protein
MAINQIGNLSSVQLIAAAGIIGNVGGISIAANTNLANNIAQYTSQSVVGRFETIVASGYISYDVVASVFPGLTNSKPIGYSIGNAANMTGTIEAQSAKILGDGDLGKFDQILSSAQGLVSQTNQLIMATINANAATNTTGYTTQDNLSTGGLSGVTQAYGVFSTDLFNLGNLIDLSNLKNLGSPAALIKQLTTYSFSTPGLNDVLLRIGIPQDKIDNLNDAEFTDQEQKILYDAMTKVTGNELSQILTLLKVTTQGITTMADLLNPVKIFPNSFNTLTTPTENGLRGIYINNTGAVNSLLKTQLPESLLVPLQGNQLLNLLSSQ